MSDTGPKADRPLSGLRSPKSSVPVPPIQQPLPNQLKAISFHQRRTLAFEANPATLAHRFRRVRLRSPFQGGPTRDEARHLTRAVTRKSDKAASGRVDEVVLALWNQLQHVTL